MLADEAGRSLYEELDFRVEAANAAEFRRAHAYRPFISGAAAAGLWGVLRGCCGGMLCISRIIRRPHSLLTLIHLSS